MPLTQILQLCICNTSYKNNGNAKYGEYSSKQMSQMIIFLWNTTHTHSKNCINVNRSTDKSIRRYIDCFMFTHSLIMHQIQQIPFIPCSVNGGRNVKQSTVYQ